MSHLKLAATSRANSPNFDIPTNVSAVKTPPDDGCFHGGAFFKAIGVGFDNLDHRTQVINADVLDAWFAPSPKV
jgi:hypothetical protein